MSDTQRHGPHLIAAVFCDQVLDEKDNVLSAIRIIDRVNITKYNAGEKLEVPMRGQLSPPLILFTLLVILKSGDYKGRGKLGIVPRFPSGKTLQRRDIDVELLGAENGMNAILRGGFPPEEEGVYWVDVYFDDQLLASSPLAIRYEESAQRKTSGSQPNGTQEEQKRS